MATLAFLGENHYKLIFGRIYAEKQSFWGVYTWLKFNNMELALGMALKINGSVQKRSKVTLKVRRFWGHNSYLYRRKIDKNLVGNLFGPCPILNKIMSVLPIFLFEANEGSISLLKILFLDCKLALVNYLKRSHFDWFFYLLISDLAI